MKRRENWRDIVAEPLEPEEVAWRLYNSAKTKARKRGLTFNLKYNDVLRPVMAGVCAVTGIPFDHRAKPARGVDLPFRASLDRIDNTIGYQADNIQIVCCIFNRSKGMWNVEDVVAMAEAIMQKQLELPNIVCRCAVCRRELRSAESVNRGIGPKCLTAVKAGRLFNGRHTNDPPNGNG
ncbi:hypothetical protein EBZ39_05950 [bacterium]|nr:hypothetical protein [bacterium]